MLLGELRLGPLHRLQQRAHLPGVADLAAVERVEDRALACTVEAQEKMSRKAEAHDVPAAASGRVHIENAERDRQSLAPVDDAYEVGVLQVVVGRAVAFITVAGVDRPVERGAALFQAGLVAARRDGPNVYYRVVDPTAFAICRTVCDALERRADEERRVVRGGRRASGVRR